VLSRVHFTLASPATHSGIGLFTAAPVRLTIHPAPAGKGLAFRRTDLSGPARDQLIPALATHIIPESRRTVLAADPEATRAMIAAAGPAVAASLPTVQTVEHLLSALAGLGVTDAIIDLDGPEIPIADGSAFPFVEAILSAGLTSSPHHPLTSSPAHPIILTEPIRLADNGSLIEALPLCPTELAAAKVGAGPATYFSYHLDYSNFPIAALAPIACRRVPPQNALFSLPFNATTATRNEYARQVAPARTFCLAEEAHAMRQAGLFTHLTPRDMLVIGDEGPIENKYRFDHPPNEPARHKLLDLIGDLALAGRPVFGRIVATRSGHAQNHEMARRLMAL
jgi:UDP-3-O-acyl-N-acetylglucosamine deacetylase